MVHRVLCIWILFLLTVATASASSDLRAYEKARGEYQALIDSSSRQMYRHNWERVIDGLLKVQRDYPRSDRADDALFLAAKASRGLARVSGSDRFASEAVDLFQRVADRYPKSNLADDALYEAGELLETELRRPQDAFRSYRRVVDAFPRGDMAPAAKLKAASLAQHAPDSATVAPPKTLSSSGPSQLRTIRSSTHSGGTRVVLELDRDVTYSWNSLGGKSPRLYVDLKGVEPSSSLPSLIEVDSGEVKQVRMGVQPDEKIRVVLDLASERNARVFTLSDPHRIVIDVGTSAAATRSDDAIAGILGKDLQQRAPRVQIRQSGSDGRIRRVVIDAGHGGKDPGAVGRGGTYEKDVVLSIVKKTASLLKKQGDIEVILTRNNDTFLPLSDRTAIANRVEADLFISVHANASESRRAYGVETYYLNFSKTDQAASVAARENNTSLKEVGDLELILFDLMANAKINESSRLAGIMQKSLVDELSGNYTKVKDLGVKQGPFYVLLGATMPSVLVEAGFISNSREEERLKSDRYQQRVARAIVETVQEYARSQQLAASR